MVPAIPDSNDIPGMAMALRVSGLTHRYGRTTALQEVSVTVPAGSLLAVVGESGSGKTTLLRAINRMVEPSAHCVFLNEEDVTTVDPVSLRRRIGYVPQAGGLLPHWTIGRNVALVPTLNAHPDPRSAAIDAMERCGLQPGTFTDRFPHELSGGQRQRAALARALAARQELVLLDEAFSALDAISRAEVLEAFTEIRAELGFTSVLVTHDLSEAARLADTIVVMRSGRIEQQGSTHDVLGAPASTYVAHLVAQARTSARRLLES